MPLVAKCGVRMLSAIHRLRSYQHHPRDKHLALDIIIMSNLSCENVFITSTIEGIRRVATPGYTQASASGK